MSARTPTSRVLVFGSILLCSTALHVGAAVAQEWDLSGEWVIDLDESDDPVEAFDAVSQARRGQSGVGVGVGIFGVPVEVARSGGRGAEPAEVVRRDLRRLRQHLVNSVDRLDIEQSADNMRIRYSNQGTVDYRPDAVLEDDEERLHAEWRRDMFTVVRDVGEELHATEQFYLDRSDPNRLRWLVSIELSSVRARTVRINRVYDRVQQP